MIFSDLIKNRYLIKVLIYRDIQTKYKGSVLGLFWALLIPLVLLLVYTFVFSVVFQARWGTSGGSRLEFALILFAGLIVFNFFSECVNRAPGIVLGNVNYVKKVVFPIEALGVVAVGSALFNFFIGFLVWLLVYSVFFGLPHLTVFLVPFYVVPLCFFILGCVWILSAVGVYLRDVSQFVGIMTTVFMFLSPIFYPVEALPDRFQKFIYINPLSYYIEAFRDIVYWGEIPSLFLSAFALLFSILFLLMSFVFFKKMKKGFADVL
ncbi:ABC transporter permease [Alcaligenes sp. DN25]|uniref:ABC transporter permease n=1 Tax=Alcaligenes TaxID=507 RepID=UPI002030F3DE|nr:MULTISPECIES: ABC transporter permease [Alcaligenes]URW82382.1 ABC transporter permease [Alcaligenes sp. DN25]WEA67205.1 ABC transporter permease [Alcaligenes faecalis]